MWFGRMLAVLGYKNILKLQQFEDAIVLPEWQRPIKQKDDWRHGLALVFLRRFKLPFSIEILAPPSAKTVMK